MTKTVYPSNNAEHPEVTIASRNIVVYAQGQPILQSPHFEAYAGGSDWHCGSGADAVKRRF